MRYLLLTLSLMGGLLSFNSFAANCPSGIKIPSGTYKPVIPGILGTDTPFSININGCEYRPINDNYIAYTEGPLKDAIFSSDGYISTGVPILSNVPESLPFDPDVKPDIPDVTPPPPDIKPPSPGGGSGGGSQSYLSAVLSEISSSDARYLYRSFIFHYDTSASWDSNVAVAKAYLNKLTNVTPPDYYSVDRVRDMMDAWEKKYQALKPSGTFAFHWYASRFVGGEHRFTGSVVIADNSCEKPPVGGYCADIRRPLDINDPDYASLSDYRNGITRCERNPNDPLCHSSGGGGSGSGDSDSGGGNTDTGGKPDNCPPGSYHKPGTPEGSCTTDFNPEPEPAPNPGGGGGSGSGNTDSNDNGDVVAAINAFHADANKNHKEAMNKLDVSDADVAGIKNGLVSDINDLISSTRKEISDSYDAGISELKSMFGDIDSYIPDIKLSFELPTQFTAGIQGHCVPLVFDFNISLIGLSPYHFHAEGIQACKLYDLYIRSIVEYVFYFITALACRRIFTRAAEFITSS